MTRTCYPDVIACFSNVECAYMYASNRIIMQTWCMKLYSYVSNKLHHDNIFCIILVSCTFSQSVINVILCYAMLCNDLLLGFLDRLLHFTLPRLYAFFLYEIGRFLFQSSSFIYTTTGQQGARVCYVTRIPISILSCILYNSDLSIDLRDDFES